ncbi:hypothetical protein JG687_00018926 [Phytophthora cactorum]|uniref:DDE-1 domain-containing protein n=1 Tax=Phytophthora cactorum TaxID=29920 RepID=A0A8T1TMK1_9STRA|nr:hypothetical protein JG687_00018926 [Phytophthora cactorum]
MRKNWVNFMLLQLRSNRTSIPFKLKPPSRHEMIMWTKAAWKSLPPPVVASTFCKAKIILKQQISTHVSGTEQTLLDTEPDWELFNQLLEEIPVVRHVVDSSRDSDTLAVEE